MRAFRSDLQALARKYRALGELRRGVLAPEPAVLRALAREFPGALRELECLPLDAIDRRLASVVAATRGAPLEEWIPWMLDYHRHMRIALAVKRWLAGYGDHRRAAPDIARRVWVELHERCDTELVARIARPPAGRLNRLIFEQLEREHGRPAVELEAMLFPALLATCAPSERGR